MKIREKLIHWLGGYTEQIKPEPQIVTYRHIYEYPITVKASTKADVRSYYEHPEVRKMMVEDICHKIAEYLTENDLVTIEKYDEGDPYFVSLAGTLRVYKPEDSNNEVAYVNLH